MCVAEERDEIVRKCAEWLGGRGVCLPECVQECVMQVAWRDDMQSL